MVSKYHPPLKGARALEKWLILGLGKKYKMSLEHLVAESKKCSKNYGD